MATPDITTKTCSKCARAYPATTDYFHKRSKSVGGLRPDCKICRQDESKAYYSKNASKIYAYNRKWVADNPEKAQGYQDAFYDKHRDEINARIAQWKIDNPEKVKAEAAVMIAVRRGDMPKATALVCAKCGGKAQHYHHHSYEPEFWLDVTRYACLVISRFMQDWR